MHADDFYPETSNSLGGRLAVWLATGLGLGLAAPAPGTLAGLWGLGLAAAVSLLRPLEVQLGVMALLAWGAVAVCGKAVRVMGSRSDPGAIVLDEIVALPIVFIGAPPMNWALLLTGYLLFRVCDIWKPGLVGAAEKLPGGWGIVADDCVAAVLAALLLQATLWIDGAMGYHWLLDRA